MDGYSFVHRERVRFRDVDGAGHVNNAVFLTYIEGARFEYMRHLGLLRPIDDLGMILARVEIDFRAPIEFGDDIDIGARVGRFGTKSFDLDHALYVGDRLVAEARTVLVAYDYERRESIPLPDDWRERLAAPSRRSRRRPQDARALPVRPSETAGRHAGKPRKSG